jgi:hypothetical protein
MEDIDSRSRNHTLGALAPTATYAGSPDALLATANERGLIVMRAQGVATVHYLIAFHEINVLVHLWVPDGGPMTWIETIMRTEREWPAWAIPTGRDEVPVTTGAGAWVWRETMREVAGEYGDTIDAPSAPLVELAEGAFSVPTDAGRRVASERPGRMGTHHLDGTFCYGDACDNTRWH